MYEFSEIYSLGISYYFFIQPTYSHDYTLEIVIMCSFGVPIIIVVNTSLLLIWRRTIVRKEGYF
jgi:hypothetical protein